jgi:hypothetical protein
MDPSSNAQPKLINIDPIKVSVTLALIWSIIVAYATAGQISKFFFSYHLPATMFFFLDSEMNLPALFSGLMLLLSSLILAFICYVEKPHPNAKYWLVLSLAFLFLSFDEVFSIHENIFSPLTMQLIGKDHLGIGVLTYEWVLPYTIFAGVIGLYFLRFIFSLPNVTKTIFIISGFTYVGAAIGVEGITGAIAGIRGTDNFGYIVTMTIEEAFEMYAICLFIFGLLHYLQKLHHDVTLSFGKS